MCKLSDWLRGKPQEKPDWVTQTRAEVAQAERDAAAIHYTWMTLIEDGTLPPGYEEIGGDYKHHEYWWIKHLEAAWYTENSEDE